MTGSPTIECPKCGRTVPDTAECAACGVVFAKIRPVDPAARTSSPAAFPELQPPPASPQQSFRLGPILALLALVAAGSLAALEWVDNRAAETDVPVQPIEAQRPEPAPGPAPAPQPAPRARSDLGATPAPRSRPAPAPEPEPRKARWVDPDFSWFQGASGFSRGLERAQTKNQAVLVYFYTDWCPYCRQLESELLGRAVVEEYTKYLVKIRVNPEKGASERALAGQYGVAGYPSVFIHPAGLGGPQKIRGMTKKTGEWRLLSPQAYVENLVSAAGERFGPS
ncbi:MAG: thioredoxin fold domain-containing protein [Thermoanaerobaculia bacterium]